ncbi:MAG: 3-dehydroquinate synthase [bacterium]
MKTIRVELPGVSYPIYIGPGSLASHLPALVNELAPELVVVVSNETVHRLYPNRPAEVLRASSHRVETCLVPDGERFKTLATLGTIYERLMELQANRRSVLLAFGGGVVGDMAGFAAATFMRGIPVIQLPTTLVAQVDSSVGGKTGVNLPAGKNAVGSFKQPAGVVIDPTLLATLPGRELRAGLFELIKHGIIHDPALFDFLEANRPALTAQDWDFWEEAVARSCQVKARVVQQDPHEKGLRAILNFGHSLGHLIETHTGYEACLHGEAVGIGMLFAAFVSREWGLLQAAEFERIRALLEPLATTVVLPPLDEAGFAAHLMHDKKAERGTLRFIVLEGLGRAAIREGTTPAELWPFFQRFEREFPGLLRVEGG